MNNEIILKIRNSSLFERDNLDYACLWTYKRFMEKTELIWKRSY